MNIELKHWLTGRYRENKRIYDLKGAALFVFIYIFFATYLVLCISLYMLDFLFPSCQFFNVYTCGAEHCMFYFRPFVVKIKIVSFFLFIFAFWLIVSCYSILLPVNYIIIILSLLLLLLLLLLLFISCQALQIYS